MNIRTVEVSFSTIGKSILINLFDTDNETEKWIMIDNPTDDKIKKVIGFEVWTFANEEVE